MLKKKIEGTKQEQNPKKIDNIEKQQPEQEDKPIPIKWEELDKHIGQPVWDTRKKKWRVLDGYKRMQNTYAITFSDIADWVSFNDRFLYLKEVCI